MGGFHLFDVLVRLTEEWVFHPTHLYQFLDRNFGISKVDPFIQFGIYEQSKQIVGAQTYSMGTYPANVTVPAGLPPPPAASPITEGGQLPPSRRRRPAGKAKHFG